MTRLYTPQALQGDLNFEGWSIELVNHPSTLAALRKKVEQMPICGLDTESDGPLLVEAKWSKTGIQKHKNFINMYRSVTVGYSLAFPDRTAYYVPLNHRRDNASYGPAIEILRIALSKPCWAHNAKHELLALHQLGIGKDWPQLRCSQVSSFLGGIEEEGGRGLKQLVLGLFKHQMATFEETAKGTNFGTLKPKDGLVYAAEDAIGALLVGLKSEKTIGLWGLEDWYLDTEMPFLRVLREMTDEGLHFNQGRALVVGKELQMACAQYAQEFEALTECSPSSPVQLQALFERGWWPKTKAIKTGWSTDAETIEGFATGLRHKEGRRAAELLLAFRESAKGASTYTVSLAENAAQYPDGKLHPDYMQDGTDTGRLSSSNPNGQNMPAHGDLAKRIMSLFEAPEGAKYLSADYSQIDLRVLAHFAGGRLQQAYLNGEDIHQITADAVGCDRGGGKTVNFAIVYGAQAKKLASQMGVTKQEAQKFLDGYDRLYPTVPRVMNRIVAAAYDRGYVKTLGGRRRLFPEMPLRDRTVVNQGFRAVNQGLLTTEELMVAWGDERRAKNTVCQGGAADVIKKAMVALHQQKPEWLKFHAQIHDDIRLTVYDATPERLTEATALVKQCMESAFELKVPLVAEPVVGDSWRDLK